MYGLGRLRSGNEYCAFIQVGIVIKGVIGAAEAAKLERLTRGELDSMDELELETPEEAAEHSRRHDVRVSDKSTPSRFPSPSHTPNGSARHSHLRPLTSYLANSRPLPASFPSPPQSTLPPAPSHLPSCPNFDDARFRSNSYIRQQKHSKSARRTRMEGTEPKASQKAQGKGSRLPVVQFIDIASLPVIQNAWTGPQTKLFPTSSERRTYFWSANETVLIVDRMGRTLAVLLGKPNDDPKWNVGMEMGAALMDSSKTFNRKQQSHRRGPYPAIS